MRLRDAILAVAALACFACGTEPTDKTVDAALVIEAAGDHTVYLNVADSWAASGDAGALIQGTVTLEWTYLSA